MKFRLGELEKLTAGQILQGEEGRFCSGFSTDTRTLRHGDIFVALNGKNYRGAEFVGAAIAAGASGVISEEPRPESLPEGVFHLRVEDTTKALGVIGSAWRRKVNPRVVAVVGSSGKTTTKEMAAHLCCQLQPTLSTEGNLNNLIGVPLTLLRLQPSDRIAVIEIGMNVRGELAELTTMIDPEFVIYTNIGDAHIGNFGSLQALIEAKAEPLRAMRRDATVILCNDCPNVSAFPGTQPLPDQVYWYGEGPLASVRANGIKPLAPYGYDFELDLFGQKANVRLDLFGRYQILNSLGAATAAGLLGMSAEQVADAMTTFVPPKMRAQTEWYEGIFILLDCYNASPSATIRSLASFCDVTGLKRRFALIGDMLELGDLSEHYHRQVGAAVAKFGLDGLITVGSLARYASMEAEQLGVSVRHFEDGDAAAAYLSRELRAEDGLMVKGSRGVRIETVLLRMKNLRSDVTSGGAVATPMEVRAC